MSKIDKKSDTKAKTDKKAKQAKTEKDASLTFEEALEELKAMSQKLEKENLSLDESLTLYQEGIVLAKLCHAKLEAAEQVVKEVMLENDKVKLENFQVEDDF